MLRLSTTAPHPKSEYNDSNLTWDTLEFNKKEYFIDMLLYQRNMCCLVALELKIGSFKPEYIGKMNFYLN